VIVFSAIAPIILVIGSLAFALLWVTHRYSFLYVNREESDNGGKLYPVALFQLFTGLYVLELCLIGLFALGQNAQGAPGCLPQAVMMSMVLICTALYHRKLVEVYSPLFSRTVMDGLGKDGVCLDKEMYPLTHHEKRIENPVRQPVLTERPPVVWIPKDPLGVSDGEVRQTRGIHGMGIIPISNENATLDNKGRVVCHSLEPPSQD
jgi:hypothetical protein